MWDRAMALIFLFVPLEWTDYRYGEAGHSWPAEGISLRCVFLCRKSDISDPQIDNTPLIDAIVIIPPPFALLL